VLIALAQSRLTIVAGSRMAEIVDSCLTSLDSGEGLGRGSGFQMQAWNEKEIGADLLQHSRISGASVAPYR
jgi:hypothetical protein